MKYFLCILSLLTLLMIPVRADTLIAPEAPDDVKSLIQSDDINLLERIRYLFAEGIRSAQPTVAPTAKLCGYLLCAMLLFALTFEIKGNYGRFLELSGVFAISTLLLSNTGSMLRLGIETVQQITDYSKLLLPVLTAALAAQGGSVSATALYSVTALFSSILSGLMTKILFPMISVFLVFATISAATEDEFLRRLRDLTKQIMSWSLKILLYGFTGFISITGIISGTADQMAIKAAKLTISGMVPVVGGILSDASETILVGAGMVKSTIGVYGMLAVLAITIVPFLKVGISYLFLKLTCTAGSAYAPKTLVGVLTDFTTAMGFVLAITGSVCLIQLISTVCFLKGMS